MDNGGPHPMQFLKSFAFAALFLTLVPSLLSGCRFGNRNKVTTAGYDTISGYYATEPLSFEAEVHLSSGAQRTTALPVSTMPAYYRASLTNPVILLLQSVKTGAAYLVSKDDQNYNQPTVVDQAAMTFGLAETQALNHYGCRVELSVADAGKFNVDTPGIVGGITVRGRLSITRDFEIRFTGTETNCQELRDIFHLCLTDEPNCPNEMHLTNARILYQSFFTAGAMTAEEIKTATYLRHTAKHQ